MLEWNYPAGHHLYAAVHCGGSFWVVTRGSGSTMMGFEYVLANDRGFCRAVRSPPASNWYLAEPRFFDHPEMPGLSVGWPGPDQTVATHALTGKEFVAGPGRPRLIGEGGTAGFGELREWTRGLPNRVDTALTRRAFDDRRVVMTGSEAVANGPLVMGPTASAGLSAVRGLRQYHVACYTRGGSSRVMRLPRRSNPVHVVLHPEGTTFLAACFYRAFLIDFDTGGE